MNRWIVKFVLLSTGVLLFGACALGIQPPTTPGTTPTAATEATTTTPVTGTATTSAPTGTVPAETPVVTATTTSTTTADAPVVPAEDAASARLKVPEGFAVRIYAKDLDEPRLMTLGPDGYLYVAERGANSVVRLTDANNDGLADENQVIATGLDGVHSLEWHEDWLYVSEGGQIERLQDKDGDGQFETKELVTDNIPAPVHHTSRTLHFGPDGKLYVTTGSSSNNDPETDPRRAAMLRFNADGSIPEDNPFATDANEQRRPIWAEGLRNSVDFIFLADGRIWADHQGSDELGDDVPPEEVVNQVEKGKHYGWPYCYTPTEGVVPAGTKEVHDERVPFGDDVASCDVVAPAIFTDLAHSAPIGMTQYNGAAFPADYQGNLFEAYHGSWNSSVSRDCKVQRIVVQDGAPVSSETFMTGFRDNDQQQCGSAWGRPAGVTVGANGELFVSDDQNGNIYRIVYIGG
ncbi:MAG: PQQ-dependent sugar dehydrogenase [Chloroflexi bacterium]|nr:PQQ-dependent sugar dehydrogenase [Chloroflexota bacterium]